MPNVPTGRSIQDVLEELNRAPVHDLAGESALEGNNFQDVLRELAEAHSYDLASQRAGYEKELSDMAQEKLRLTGRLNLLELFVASLDASPCTETPAETNGNLRQLWVVIGGEDKGGVLVRKGEGVDSQVCTDRLCTGAIVEEIKLSGDRLHFHRLIGTGPKQGWISVRAKGKDLAVRSDRKPLKPRQPVPGVVGESSDQPLPIVLSFQFRAPPRGLLSTYRDVPAVKEMLETTKLALGLDILEDYSDDDHSIYPPVASFIGSLAYLERLKHEKPYVVRRASAVIGSFFGHYAALCAAGVLPFTIGLKLRELHHWALQEARQRCAQRSLVVSWIEEEKLRSFCIQASKEGGRGAVCEITADSGPYFFMVGGTKRAVDQVEELARDAGAKTFTVCDIAINSTLMRPAQAILSAGLDQALPRMKQPLHTVWVSTTAEPARPGCKPADIVDQLKETLVVPELHKQCTEAMLEDGISELYYADLSRSSLEPIKSTSEDGWFPLGGQNSLWSLLWIR